MAATKSRPAGNGAVTTAKHAGDAVADTARRAGKPALAAGAAAAGLAGGLLVGARIGAGSGLLVRRRSRKALAVAGAKRLAATAVKASSTADDIHALREHVETLNRRSPIEVLLDALTHRRGIRGGH
jgi:hypothetical protein